MSSRSSLGEGTRKREEGSLRMRERVSALDPGLPRDCDNEHDQERKAAKRDDSVLGLLLGLGALVGLPAARAADAVGSVVDFAEWEPVPRV
jgi:hypothetical protein